MKPKLLPDLDKYYKNKKNINLLNYTCNIIYTNCYFVLFLLFFIIFLIYRYYMKKTKKEQQYTKLRKILYD